VLVDVCFSAVGVINGLVFSGVLGVRISIGILFAGGEINNCCMSFRWFFIMILVIS
jgi:hypothetical protein